MKYKSATIKKITLPRYQVLAPDGKVLKTFSTLRLAKAWIDGYLKAVKTLQPRP